MGGEARLLYTNMCSREWYTYNHMFSINLLGRSAIADQSRGLAQQIAVRNERT
jgi:hypothetical protein